MSQNKTETRPRMVIFHDDEAVEVDEEMMPREGFDEATMEGLKMVAEAGVAEGVGDCTRVVFREPGDDGMSLVHCWFKSGYILPFHSHNADCLYYVVGGELRMGSHVLKKGDGFFIPADYGYGYEAGPEGVEVLEFRNTSHFNFAFVKNPAERWDRIAETFTARTDIWREESPPSGRS